MITINAKFSQEMQSLGLIGRVGENASRQIVFDCSEVLTEFSGASILCVLRRSKDEMPYTADVTMSGTNATLTLTDTDLAVAGYLSIELRAIKDGVVYKSSVFTGTVALSLYGDADKPGEVVRDVLDRVDAALNAAEATKNQLESALGDVTAAVGSANTAANNAQSVADNVQAKLDNGDFVGEQGPKGDKGDTGPKGATGDKGEKGDTGAQGEKGDKGDTGSQGERGQKGDQGAQGPQGPQGVSGVYVGSGDMPDGYDIQIDPSGTFTPVGTGDMAKSVYDTDGNGIVDNAERLGGKAPSEYADAGSLTALQGTVDGHGDQIGALQTAVDGKAPAVHTHAIADVTGLQAALNGKGTGDMKKSVYDADGDGVVDNAQKLDGKAATEFAAAVHGHEISDVNGLQAKLDTIPAAYTLPKATRTSLGGVRIIGALEVDSSGQVWIRTTNESAKRVGIASFTNSDGTEYLGIYCGDGLEIDSDGKLKNAYSMTYSNGTLAITGPS